MFVGQREIDIGCNNTNVNNIISVNNNTVYNNYII